MQRRFSLIIFDLDGTLVDSAPDICRSLNAVLAAHGLEGVNADAVRGALGEGQRAMIERMLTRVGGSLALADIVQKQFRERYDRDLILDTAPYPGVRETLAAVHPDVMQAIASNKPGGWTRRIAEALGFTAHMRAVIGGDEVSARKPNPAILLEICRRLDVPPERTLSVGDSPIDLQAARAAGMPVALFRHGYGSADLAAAAGPRAAADPPCWLVDRLTEILLLLGVTDV
jgi:phosphoglycolate phosphatase